MANTNLKSTSDVASIAALTAAMTATVVPAKQTLPTAPAEKGVASKAGWTGNLVWGTFAIAVKTYKATETEEIKLNMIHVVNKAEIDAAKAAGKPVPAPQYAQVKRGSNISAQTEKEVPADEILKGFKYGEGQYVVVSDDDKKACMVGSDKTMTIDSFVEADLIDPIYFEAAEYVAPDATAQVFTAVFGLLRATMVDRGVVAIAKCNQRGREQTLILRPYGTNGMTAHYLFFDNEVRSFDKWTNVNVSADQIAAAGQLVDAMTEDTFDPTQYEDGYMRTLRGRINSLIDGTTAPTVTIPAAPVADKKMDIMAMLSASMSAISGKKKAKAASAA